MTPADHETVTLQLAPYGWRLSENDFLVNRTGTVTEVKISKVGKRFLASHKDRRLWSGPEVGVFVHRFYCAEKYSEAELLAIAFCKELRDLLTLEQLTEVQGRNRSEENPNICHSHDFCDPNVAMLAALGEPFDPSSATQTALINKAWGIAKKAGFTL